MDESLQSFLFRQQMLFAGELNPKGVITKDGMWYSYPYAHQEVQHIFHRFDDSVLLEAAEVGEPIKACLDGIFTPPDSYCLSLRGSFFSNEKWRSRMSCKTGIRFCQACVNEAISEYGHGYFRHQWLKNTWCYVHELPLRHLTSTSYRNAIEDVKEVLVGGIPVNEVCTQKRPSEVAKSSLGNNTKKLELFFAVHAPYCLGRLLASWLRLNLNKLCESNKFIIREEWFAVLFKLLVLPIDSYDYLQAIRKLNALIIFLGRRSTFSEYMSEHVGYVRMFVSPRRQLSEVMMLPKERDCGLCAKKEDCAVMNLEYSEIKEEVDLQFLFRYSHSFKRYALDQGYIDLTGNHAWMPFRINSLMSEEEMKKGELMKFES
ncbi:hypothetical protein HG263_15405 [Pseudoalteromonas sp. JBTF-M23]|uniref:TniQ protein n=1 Tax=Pseudoalteromonas caenipelagi TaxID=2726988 RepID=A0A849VJN2_9GAMM|nr:hypothetical protein [Pseudoalteromonas caenipelagi]NOU51921.1 hypothetical protein [Pseudoalteromonas caenipelagi]